MNNSDNLDNSNNQKTPDEFMQEFLANLRFKFFRLQNSKYFSIETLVLIILSIMLITVLLSFTINKGIEVIKTNSAYFINQDKVKYTGSIYDKNTNTAEIFLQTSSPFGVIAPNNLKTDIILLNPPKLKLNQHHQVINQITEQLIPTTDNHFVLIVKNLNPDFKAMEVQITNKDHDSVTQYATGITNEKSQNYQKIKSNRNPYISQKLTNQIKKYSKATTKAGANSDLDNKLKVTNPEQFQKAYDAVKKINDHDLNKVNLILTQHQIEKNVGNIPIDITPQTITINSLNQAIQDLQNDIQAQILILDSKKSDLSQLNHTIEINTEELISMGKDPNEDLGLQDLKTNQTNLQTEVNEINQKIKKDQDYINQYQDQIQKINSNQIQFSTPSIAKNVKFEN